MATTEALLSEGRSLAGQHRHVEAVDFLVLVAEKTPEDPRPLYLLAFCQGNLGQGDAASASLNAACQLERKGKQFGWPTYMEHIQGPMRIWMETERNRQLGEKGLK